jgi:hypothetical protein
VRTCARRLEPCAVDTTGQMSQHAQLSAEH